MLTCAFLPDWRRRRWQLAPCQCRYGLAGGRVAHDAQQQSLLQPRLQPNLHNHKPDLPLLWTTGYVPLQLSPPMSCVCVCVQGAGRQIAKAASPLDGQLFVIQHLLFLREQIAHFDVDLTVTDIDLDFSHMRDHVRRIMTGE